MNELLDKPVFRISLYAGVIAIVLTLVFVSSREDVQESPIPGFTPGTQINPTDSPTSTPLPNPSPTTVDDAPDDDHAHNDNDGHHSHDVETELSQEGQEAAEKTIIEGVEHYFTVGSRETLEARSERLSPYFLPGSPYLDINAPENLIMRGESDTPDSIIEQSGIIQWSNPQNADSDSYETLLALNIQAMFTGGGASEMIQGVMVLQIVAENISGDWVITSMTEVDA